MNKILCSTGTLIGRPNGRDFTLLLKHQDRINADGYEFMMYDSWYEKLDDIRRVMQSFTPPVLTFHIDKSIGELASSDKEEDRERALGLFKINSAFARELGAKKLVLHLWNGPTSDANIGRNIECYKFFREIADTDGIALTVENVVCSHGNPMDHFKALANLYPDIEFTFDTKMAGFHNQLDYFEKEENRNLFRRVSHIHLNDYGGGYMDWENLRTLHIGKGHLDFDKFFAFLKSTGYSGDFTVEATSFDKTGAIDLGSLNACLDLARKYISSQH